MANKTTRKALLFSSLSLLLCFAMLLGTTFAWFTDSVTSAGNKIQAGTLDVELWMGTGVDSYADISTNTNPIFGSESSLIAQNNNADTLWEPGKTQVAYLMIKNAGNLALKYEVALNTINPADGKDLYKVMQYQIVPDAKYASVTGWTTGLGVTPGTAIVSGNNVPMQPGDEHYFALLVHMDENAGNEYMNGKVAFDLTVLATQLEAEKDSFGSDYDKDATIGTPVSNATELADALATGGNVVLASDVFVDKKLEVAAGKEVVLDLGGNKLSGMFTQQGVSALIQNRGTLTVKNGTVISLATNPDTDWNPEGFPTYASNTISNSGVLVVESGAVIENETNVGGASYAIDNYAGAKLTINGGEIKAKDVAIRINTASTSAANNVTINGGTITGKRAIWIHIAGSNSAQAPEVNLTINNGDFNSTSDHTIYSYSYGQSFSKVNVIINGGDFEKNVSFGGGYKGDQEAVTVNGGVFHGELGRYLANDGWEDIQKP